LRPASEAARRAQSLPRSRRRRFQSVRPRRRGQRSSRPVGLSATAKAGVLVLLMSGRQSEWADAMMKRAGAPGRGRCLEANRCGDPVGHESTEGSASDVRRIGSVCRGSQMLGRQRAMAVDRVAVAGGVVGHSAKLVATHSAAVAVRAVPPPAAIPAPARRKGSPCAGRECLRKRGRR